MAAGAACKLRMHVPTSDEVKFSKALKMIREFGAGYENTLHLFELTYAGAFSNGFTEISPPNAVFDGRTASIPLALFSSDAGDTVAGAGIRHVAIICLNSSGELELLEYDTDGTGYVDVDDFPKRIMHMYGYNSPADAVGNIILASRGYQQLDIAGLTLTTATGLAASTQYYFKVNVDGAGVVEYDITTGTDVTYSAVIALMNAELTGGAVDAQFSITDGKLRCTSGSAGATATSAIALSAGATGTDLFATLTGWNDFEVAVDGVDYLQISAGAVDSDGSAIYLPEDWMERICEATVTPTNIAAAARGVAVRVNRRNFDGEVDPDFDYDLEAASGESGSKTFENSPCHFADSNAYLQNYETYLGGATNGYIRLLIGAAAIDDTSRGMDISQ